MRVCLSLLIESEFFTHEREENVQDRSRCNVELAAWYLLLFINIRLIITDNKKHNTLLQRKENEQCDSFSRKEHTHTHNRMLTTRFSSRKDAGVDYFAIVTTDV